MGLAVIVALVVANMILIPLAIRHAQGSGDRGTRQRLRPPHVRKPQSKAGARKRSATRC